MNEEILEKNEEAELESEKEVSEVQENQSTNQPTEPEKKAEEKADVSEEATDEEHKQEEWFVKDAEEFQKAYPDIDTDELFKDKAFLRFSEGKVGTVGLADIYRDYNDLVEGIRKDTLKKAEEEFAKRRANAKATPGSLTEVTGEADSLYSLEDMKTMSQKAIIDNWDKVQKSLKNLKK